MTPHEPAQEEAEYAQGESGSAQDGRTRAGTVGRRGLFGAVGASMAGGAALGAAGTYLAQQHTAPEERTARTHPFRGDHQSGIVTPAQDCLFTGAFDLTTSSVDEVRDLMTRWCGASEQMTAGELVGGSPLANPYAPPTDTGEAWGYPPASLTITVGVGGSFFVGPDGTDRFGLADRAGDVLSEGIPRFRGEALQSEQSHGDVIVQACADDAQVAVHAIRNLTRIAQGTAVLKWTQIGQGRTSSTSVEQETPRNLFGFKDGTANMKAEDGPAELMTHLWVQPEDSAGDWLSGGTYMMVRKIRMLLEMWDRLGLKAQEDVIGRDKRIGAALSVAEPESVEDEFTAADYEAEIEGGLAIPHNAHIRVVAPENNQGARMLRRGYNYTEGSDSLGQLKAGLFFLAFVRDPREGFFPILDRMTKNDALEEYLQHVATGMYAMFPGIGPADTMFGQRLLAP